MEVYAIFFLPLPAWNIIYAFDLVTSRYIDVSLKHDDGMKSCTGIAEF